MHTLHTISILSAAAIASFSTICKWKGGGSFSFFFWAENRHGSYCQIDPEDDFLFGTQRFCYKSSAYPGCFYGFFADILMVWKPRKLSIQDDSKIFNFRRMLHVICTDLWPVSRWNRASRNLHPIQSQSDSISIFLLCWKWFGWRSRMWKHYYKYFLEKWL